MPREEAPCKHMYLGLIVQNAVSHQTEDSCSIAERCYRLRASYAVKKDAEGAEKEQTPDKNGLWGHTRSTCPDRKPGGLGTREVVKAPWRELLLEGAVSRRYLIQHTSTL